MAEGKNPIELIIEALKSQVPSVDNLTRAFLEMDESSKSVLTTLGGYEEQLYTIKQSIVGAKQSLELLGGTAEDAKKILNESAQQLNRNIVLNSESLSQLYATSKLTGQGYGELIDGFKNAGYSVYDVGEKMTGVVNTARGLGVNTQEVSKQVLNNMDAINKFTFQGGIEGMAKMAAQAANLRVDMSSTLRVANDLLNPDKAIEMAAAMQRLGVTQSSLLDPLKLMDLAQNDPAELQNQIVKMTEGFAKLNRETGKFEIPSAARRDLMEISKSLGVSYEEITKMALGSRELGDKMSKIRFPDAFTEDQKQMIANMAEMKNGEYKITYGDKPMNLDEFMETMKGSPEKLEKFLEDSKPKSMEDLIKRQTTVLDNFTSAVLALSNNLPMGVVSSQLGNKGTIMANDLVIEGGKLVKDFLSPQGIGKLTDKVGVEVLQTVMDTITGNGNLLDGLMKLKDSAGDVGDYFKKEVEKLKEVYEKTEALKPIINKILDFDKLMTNGQPLPNPLLTLPTGQGQNGMGTNGSPNQMVVKHEYNFGDGLKVEVTSDGSIKENTTYEKFVELLSKPQSIETIKNGIQGNAFGTTNQNSDSTPPPMTQ